MLLEILVEIVLTWVFHVTFSSINYLLNMSSFCIGSISWFVLLFRYSAALLTFQYFVVYHKILFRQYSAVPPVFRCSTSVLVFCQCSVVLCSVVPCSGIPDSIVCRIQRSKGFTRQFREHTQALYEKVRLLCCCVFLDFAFDFMNAL